jgi:hypothetical protein
MRISYLLRVVFPSGLGVGFARQVGDGGARLEQQRVQRAVGLHGVVVGLVRRPAAPLGPREESRVRRVAHARQHRCGLYTQARTSALRRLASD